MEDEPNRLKLRENMNSTQYFQHHISIIKRYFDATSYIALEELDKKAFNLTKITNNENRWNSKPIHRIEIALFTTAKHILILVYDERAIDLALLIKIRLGFANPVFEKNRKMWL